MPTYPSPASASEDPSKGFLEAAASGSVEALVALREYSIEAGARGLVSEAESQIAATVYGHMAASFGGVDAWRRLASILKLTTASYRDRGLAREAQRDELEATHLLRHLAEIGDDEAGALLADISLNSPPMDESQEDLHSRLKRRVMFSEAARGNLAAASNLIDESVLASADKFGGLVIAEQAARLASATGDSVMSGKLVGVLYLRALYELDGGTEARALSCLTEAVAIMLRLVEMGDETVIPHLVNICNQLSVDCFAFLADESPELLLYRSFEGAA